MLAVGASAESLRIGLVRQLKEVPEITVSSMAGFTVSDSVGNVISTAGAAGTATISAEKGILKLTRVDDGSAAVGKTIVIASPSPDALLTLSSSACKFAQYRGKIEVKPGKIGLLVVNIVDLEDYIRGVLPSEMPPSFNIEALKAQAVAARTYAWMNRDRHKHLGYDLCDSTHCQVYHGALNEKASTSKAVAETEGRVIVYDGKLIWAQYCSDCGGITQDGGKPYLRSVSDSPEGGGADYCSHSGHSWVKSWSLPEFEKLLAKSYPKLQGIKSVKVAGIDSSNRVNEVEIDAESGMLSITGTRIRNLLGNTTIKSTVFTVKLADGKVTFEGRGFGHGVGLCQFGANGLAAAPNNYTFEQILKHYYSGVEIVPISSVK